MSVYDILINGCSDIANTIRELTGKTEAISPLNFDEEIRKIVTARDLLDKTITEYDFQDKISIPEYAFYKCANLSKVNCSNITNIGAHAFYDCTSLSSIELPDTVETIGTNAFQQSGLTEIVLPPNLTKLNGNVFIYCKKLESITFNDKIQSIGHMTFRGCNALEQDIILPESCKTIGQEAFRASPIKSLSGYLTTISNGAFRECSELKTLTLKGDTVCTLSATSAFTDTPIALGEGYIVIDTGNKDKDAELLSEYVNATNWSAYASQIRTKNGSAPDIWE